MGASRIYRSVVAIAKQIGPVGTILVVLALVGTVVIVVGLAQFFLECVLSIGSGCDM